MKNEQNRPVFKWLKQNGKQKWSNLLITRLKRDNFIGMNWASNTGPLEYWISICLVFQMIPAFIYLVFRCPLYYSMVIRSSGYKNVVLSQSLHDLQNPVFCYLICMAWPSKVWMSFEDATSKIVMIPSMAPLATYFPSGD